MMSSDDPNSSSHLQFVHDRHTSNYKQNRVYPKLKIAPKKGMVLFTDHKKVKNMVSRFKSLDSVYTQTNTRERKLH